MQFYFGIKHLFFIYQQQKNISIFINQKYKMTEKTQKTSPIQQSMITSQNVQQAQDEYDATDDMKSIDDFAKPTKRPFLKRAFGKMSEGSMRGAMFALMASAMGTGVFNLPLRCDQVGLLGFMLYGVCGGIFSFLGMYLITQVKLNTKVNSYSEMIQMLYGKVLRRIAQFCLIVYAWGITICFQVIFAKFILQLLYDVGGVAVYDDRKNEVYSTLGSWLRIGINLLAIIVNMFFILQKQMTLLQKLSLIGICAVFFNAITIFFTSIFGFKRDESTQYHGIFNLPSTVEINWFSTGSFEAFSAHFQGLASVIFCYVNHQLIFPITNELVRPTKSRLMRIYTRVNISQGMIYILLGSLGYLLLLQHEDEFPIQPMVLSSITTIFMTIGKFAMVLSLFFAVPLNMFPARQVFYETFSLEKNTKNHLLVNIGLAASSCAIAIGFQKVNSYFGLLGGTAGVIMSGGLPALCYLKSAKIDIKGMLIVIFIGIVCLGGFLGAILSVVDSS